MPVYLVGIDEAGYGPQLGPLVVSAVVFELPDQFVSKTGTGLSQVACLWTKLSAVIGKSKSSKKKITVCDSKKLYQPASGLRHLENTALAFAGLLPADNSNCLCNGSVSFVSADSFEVEAFSRALEMELNRHSIRFCESIPRIVEPREFNDGINSCGNKADFLWQISSELIRHCVRDHTADDLVIIKAGKQGGRNYYDGNLSRLFPEMKLRIVKQHRDDSSYILSDGSGGGSQIEISFVRDGDSSEFVIALASIFAKYFRELGMMKLNNFFQSHLPLLESTSGYYNDSYRFIESVAPVMAKLNLDKNNFIRNK